MLKKVNIVNMAFLKMGMETVPSLEAGQKQARTAKGLFDQTLKNLLSVYPWSFAKQNFNIPKSTNAPIADFKNAFLIPITVVKIISLGDGNRSTTAGGEYRVIGGYLHTNLDTVKLQALVVPDLNDLPEYFIEVLVERLCLDFARAMGDVGEMNVSSSLYERTLRTAKNIDSYGQTPAELESTVLIDARS